jgi:methionyl-tRNA synthetase
MEVSRLEYNKLKSGYNVQMQSISSPKPFYFTWFVIKPGEKSMFHSHHEKEMFIISKGSCIAYSSGQETLLSSGNLIIFDPFEEHSLYNPSKYEDVILFSCVWEDMKSINESSIAKLKDIYARTTIITSTPPTPNGDLHLGHISGPYLRADLYRNYLNMKKIRALHITGQDDHQSYTEYKGKKISKSANETAVKFGKLIQSTLKKSNISVDYFSKPKESKNHFIMITQLYIELKNKGFIVQKNANSLFCEKCDIYLYEVYVKGKCPNCHSDCGGNFCEACGHINDCADLLDPICNSCGEIPVTRKIKRDFFLLKKIRKKIRSYHSQLKLSPGLKSFCNKVTENIPNICTSHLSDWGIPCPNNEGQIISVWFEMGLAHLVQIQDLIDSGILENYKDWEDCLKSENINLVQFFGFDNSFFNCILFPGIFIALGLEDCLPDYLLYNLFYQLNYKKFSTSRNNVIWISDIIKKVDVNYLRFYLCYTNPENEETNFQFSEIESFLEKKLNWIGWVNDINNAISEFSYKTPATGLWTQLQENYFYDLKNIYKNASNYYELESFSPKRISRLICELTTKSHELYKSEKYLAEHKDTHDYNRTLVALQLLSLKIFAVIAAPIMREISERIWIALNIDDTLCWNDEITFMKEGKNINTLDTLFPLKK